MDREEINSKTNYIGIQNLYGMIEDLTIKLESNLKEAVVLDQWIDLDIDNLPDRFFTRDDIKIEFQDKLTNWCWCVFGALRSNIIASILVKEDCKYRYRIKPLDSIRINKSIADDLKEYVISRGTIEDFYNCKVEIID